MFAEGSGIVYNHLKEIVTQAIKTATRIHHIATNKHLSCYTPKFQKIVSKYGLGLDEAWNKLEMSSTFYYSKHPNAYHEFVLEGMQTADQIANGDKNLFLQLFDEIVKNAVITNPNIVNKTGW